MSPSPDFSHDSSSPSSAAGLDDAAARPGASPPTSGLAIAAMVCGLVGLALFWACGVGALLGIVGIVLGVVALGRIDREQRVTKGRGLAVTGIGTGTAAVVLTPAIMAVAVLLPALGAARKTARQMQNANQLRGVHHAMVIHAQGNGGFYPGRDRQGQVAAAAATPRLKVLLDGNYFTAEYLINPADGKQPWRSGSFTTDHFSCALLEIAQPTRRRDEWRETANPDAAVMSDRNTGRPDQPTSVWDSGSWHGTVVWNDNHTSFVPSHRLPQTVYGSQSFTGDSLFEEDTPTGDALMVHN